MKKETCTFCKRKAKDIIVARERYPLCTKHLLSEYYAQNKSCLEVELDSLAETMYKTGKLGKEDILFVKEAAKQFPYIKKEFPILFKKNAARKKTII